MLESNLRNYGEKRLQALPRADLEILARDLGIDFGEQTSTQMLVGAILLVKSRRAKAEARAKKRLSSMPSTPSTAAAPALPASEEPPLASEVGPPEKAEKAEEAVAV